MAGHIIRVSDPASKTVRYVAVHHADEAEAARLALDEIAVAGSRAEAVAQFSDEQQARLGMPKTGLLRLV